MKRSLAKWYVSRSMDLNKPLPTWVANSIDRDSSLRNHMEVDRILAARLRHDAASWSAGDPCLQNRKVAVPCPSQSCGRLWLAISAIVLFAVVWQLRPTAPNPPDLVHQTAIAKASWRIGRQLTERLSRESRKTIAAIPVLPTPDLGTIAKTPVEATSRFYGRALGTLHHSVKTEQQQLVNGFRRSLIQVADQIKREPTLPSGQHDTKSSSP